MSSLVLTIKSEDTQAVLQADYQLDANAKRDTAKALSRLLDKLATGYKRGVIDVQTGSAHPVAASGTLTLTSAVATDAVTIGAVTLTASSTPADEGEWEIDGADDAADAESLAAAINAHSVLSQVVSAESTSNVVTVTCLTKGVVGNQIALSSADATIVASGTHLAGGTGGITEAGNTVELGITA